MQAALRIIVVVLIDLLLILPLFGADEKDKKADPPKDAEKKPATKTKMPVPKGKLRGYETDPAAAEKKLLRQPKVTATVVSVVEDKKTLRLRIPIPYVKINQGALKNYYKAQNLQQMAQAQAQIYQLATTQKEVEWMAADEVKVRMKDPPPLFDDKGRPKRYTRRELYELKGNDKRLPGFPAEFSDIKSGQIVQVTLLQKKTGRRPIKRGKGAQEELSPDDLPKMSMIIILAEPKN